MTALTLDMMKRHWPRAVSALLAGVVAGQDKALALGEINSPLRLAHFMAQVSHESGGGTTLEENLNYSAERLMQVWPKRFPTLLEATPYAHNPRALANKVYGGRMGNRMGTEDAWGYAGKGLIQTTGRENYERLAAKVGLDVVSTPDLLTAPDTALLCACGTWSLLEPNEAADEDDIETVTRLVNGGLAGLADRKQWLGVWRKEFGL